MEPAGSPAPYGHACAGCSRAKCKCIIRNEGSCERCHRLGKECAPAALGRKRASRKPNPTARRAQLEEKLDDLVSLLRAQHAGILPTQEPAGQQSGNTCAPTTDETNNDLPNLIRDPLSNTRNVPGQNLTPVTTTNVSPTPTNVELHNEEYSSTEAEHALQFFRTHHLRMFPFLYIQESTTVEELQHQKPFLWLTIRAISTKPLVRQSELGVEIRETLSRQVIVEGERSMDLLQGLLVFISWGHYFARGKLVLGLYSNIARSLISDLRLDRQAGDGGNTILCPKPWTFHDPQTMIQFRTNEERRTLLAGFIIISIFSTRTKLEPLRWVPQMEESLLKLSEDKECPGDQELVAIAKISKVAVEAATLNKYHFLPEDPSLASPAMLHIKGLQASLDQVKRTISPDVLQNRTLLSHVHLTEGLIYESALSQQPSSPSYSAFEFRRVEYLHACLQATKLSLDDILSLDPAQLSECSMVMLMPFAHCLQMIYRLSSLETPGWDRVMVRKTANVMDYMHQTGALLEKADVFWRSSTGEVGETVFGKAVDSLKLALPVWNAAFEALASGQYTGEEPVPNAMDDTLMDFTDEAWFTDVFSGWNE